MSVLEVRKPEVVGSKPADGRFFQPTFRHWLKHSHFFIAKKHGFSDKNNVFLMSLVYFSRETSIFQRNLSQSVSIDKFQKKMGRKLDFPKKNKNKLKFFTSAGKCN